MRFAILFLLGFLINVFCTEYVPTYPTREKPHDPNTFRVVKSEDQRYAVAKTDRVRLYHRRCGCHGRCLCREKRDLLYVDILMARTIAANSRKESSRPCPTVRYNERTTNPKREQP